MIIYILLFLIIIAKYIKFVLLLQCDCHWQDFEDIPSLLLGLGGFLAFYMAVGYGAQILCNFLGFLYPAIAS